MDFNDYQKQARTTAQYPQMNGGLLYPAMGLAGESGEVLDKVKKLWRNKGEIPSRNNLTAEEIGKLAMEIGDVIWYASQLAEELGIPFNEIAEWNIEKLRDRQQRNVIKSEGDQR